MADLSPEILGLMAMTPLQPLQFTANIQWKALWNIVSKASVREVFLTRWMVPHILNSSQFHFQTFFSLLSQNPWVKKKHMGCSPRTPDQPTWSVKFPYGSETKERSWQLHHYTKSLLKELTAHTRHILGGGKVAWISSVPHGKWEGVLQDKAKWLVQGHNSLQIRGKCCTYLSREGWWPVPGTSVLQAQGKV